MYGPFHLMLSAAVICLAVFCAIRAKHLTGSVRIRVLAICGYALALMEVFKQLFLYFTSGSGAYDWWYFPFQLCSMPMYLCMLLPVTGRRAGAATVDAVLTFLASYSFIGAAAALIFPEDLLRPYIALTVHGFIWHGILLFISLVIAVSAMAELSPSGFVRATGLFLVMCLIAVIINIAAEPSMNAAHSAGLVPHGYAAMFYLNPYHISPQPIVDTVQKSAGIPLGLALYVIAIIAVSGLVCMLIRRIGRR